MSLKEVKEAMKLDKVSFGIKQVLKVAAEGKKKLNVYVAKDARNETLDKLQEKNINFEFLKNKKEIAKELEIDFESEVYLVE